METSDLPEGKILLSFEGLLKQVGEVLEKVGAVAFFKSPDEEVKAAREAFAFLFFVVSLNQHSGRMWWVTQATGKAPFPDFIILMVDENPLSFAAEGVELVEVWPHVETYTKALEIVEAKFKKGYPPGFNLLVYINNKNSVEWSENLQRDLQDYAPFKNVYTIFHLSKAGGQEIEKSIVTKIRPYPIQKLTTKMDQLKPPKIPASLFEPITLSDGRTGLKMKPEVNREIVRLIKEILKDRKKSN